MFFYKIYKNTFFYRTTPVAFYNKKQEQSIQKCFSNISYAQPISDNLQIAQWQANLKMRSLTKNLFRESIFVADLEQTPFFLRSDLKIDNFAVLYHFLKT